MPPKKTKNGAKNSQEDTEASPVLTMDQILQRGREASELLNSHVYNEAFKAQMDSYLREWVNTEESEAPKREYLYHKIHAMSDTAMDLNAFVSEAIALEEEQRQSQQSEQNARDENLGYGVDPSFLQ